VVEQRGREWNPLNVASFLWGRILVLPLAAERNFKVRRLEDKMFHFGEVELQVRDENKPMG
jgi:hypothetical protein